MCRRSSARFDCSYWRAAQLAVHCGFVGTCVEQSIGLAIDDILLITEYMSEEEIRDQVVVFLPFRGYTQALDWLADRIRAFSKRGRTICTRSAPSHAWQIQQRVEDVQSGPQIPRRWPVPKVLEGRSESAIQSWRGKEDANAHAMIWFDEPLPRRSRQCL